MISCVDGGLIYLSDDEGASWVGQVQPGYERWSSVAVSAVGSAMIVDQP